MKTEHPITPRPELFNQWEDDILNERDNVDHVLDCAWRNGFQAGADQELEACCGWANTTGWEGAGDSLRAARRPKPPSLKEQALQALDLLKVDASTHGLGFDSSAIRRALEALPDV
jgi:hypothetical protein